MWRFNTTTLWHFDAGEQGPSTSSFRDRPKGETWNPGTRPLEHGFRFAAAAAPWNDEMSRSFHP